MRIDIYPQKAQYMTKEPITMVIELDHSKQGQKAVLQITHLEKTIYEETVELQNNINKVILQGMDTEFGGFGATLFQEDMEHVLCHTGFDVVSDCSRAIRYGFLSDFSTEDGKDCKDVENLRKFHINMVQYYDWSYCHDNMISDKTIYKDMMGKETDIRTVKKKINACKKYGMKSIGYGAVYAASKKYYEDHKENALFTSAEEPLIFIDTFYIMNVEKKSGWHGHIIEEYAKAVSEIGFDGIHMDTYGFPKTAFSYEKKIIKLDKEYPSLIEDTKARLNEITEDNHLIFNNVGNWPVKTVAKTPQDGIYIEVWEPYIRYSHIKQIIRDARRECEDKKPVILAAYLAPFRTDTMERAAYAAYLLTAVITVNGAYHLLLGEENGVLTQGYYVDHSSVSDSVNNKLRSYYDFIVQYMELFYDTSLLDVSMTHIGWDNTEYWCFLDNWSTDGDAGKVWFTLREKENRKLISMINLCGNEDNEWNRGKEEPEEQKDIRLQVQIDKPVKGVYFISPDYFHGKARRLSYRIIKTERGMAISFEVPYLAIWSNVWIDF